MRGAEDFGAGFDALERWIRDAGEQSTGELREVYLDYLKSVGGAER